MVILHRRHQVSTSRCALDLANGVQVRQCIVWRSTEAWVSHAQLVNELMHEWHGVGMLQTWVVLTWHCSEVITADNLAILLVGISGRNFIVELLDSGNLIGWWLTLVELACDHVLLTGAASDIPFSYSLEFILILLFAEDHFVTLMINLWKIKLKLVMWCALSILISFLLHFCEIYLCFVLWLDRFIDLASAKGNSLGKMLGGLCINLLKQDRISVKNWSRSIEIENLIRCSSE